MYTKENPDITEKRKRKLEELKKVVAGRSSKANNFGTTAEFSLHHFVGVSEHDYGQVPYLHIVPINGRIHCTLSNSKSRIALLNFMTIPIMELAAATLLVKK